MRFLNRLYNPLFDAALRRPKLAVALAGDPDLRARSCCFRCSGATSCPSSRRATSGSARRSPCRSRWRVVEVQPIAMRGILRELPGGAFGGLARSAGPTTAPTSPGSPTSSSSARSSRSTSGRSGLTKEKLTEIVRKRAAGRLPRRRPSTSPSTSATTSRRRSSGVKGENSIKVTGPDLEVNEAKAAQIMDVLGEGHGRHGHRDVPNAGPARDPDRSRSDDLLALRHQHRRHQRHRAGADRRTCR